MMQRAILTAGTALCLLASLVAEADPRADYLLHCGGCHRPTGEGLPPDVPTLVAELGPIAGSDEGRAYLVRVPGASQAPVSDQVLADIINWILSEFNADTLPGDFEPLSAAEVARSRGDTLADPLSYRKRFWGEPGEEY